MYSNFDGTLSPLDIERLLVDALKQILRHEDPVKFLQWMQKHIADYDTGEATELDRSRHTYTALAATIGRSLWNAAPLPSNHFKPLPLANPGRNDMCYCGSGRKFKHCCASLPTIPTMTSDELWPVLAPLLSKSNLAQAIKAQRVPIISLVEIASNYSEQGQPRKGIALLEPFFSPTVSNTDERYEYALTTLCNLYDDAGFNKKKIMLLDRVVQMPQRSPLRAGAWQRLAAIYLDLGDSHQAWEAFRNAQRDDPDAIDIGTLEVQLLIGEQKMEQAQERAKFWAKRLQRQGLMADEPPLNFLLAVTEDPLIAMGQVGLQMLGDSAQLLQRWLEQVSHRTLPKPGYHPIQQYDDFETDGDEGNSSNVSSLSLTTPKNLVALEQEWHTIFPLGKPFSTHNTPIDENNFWSSNNTSQWLAFLENHPEAYDSLDILDDLASALALHNQSDTPWLDDILLSPLLDRARYLLEQTLSAKDEPRLLWVYPENRPALRSLARLSNLYYRQEKLVELSDINSLLLNLNPQDNHGFRMSQINHYLKIGDNESALMLANAYPDDMHPETRYGKVLALVRLGRLEEAYEGAHAAIKELPKVARYLTQNRIKKPKLDYNYITLGGDDQAWFYREDMREEWKTTPGIIDWLKKQAKHII